MLGANRLTRRERGHEAHSAHSRRLLFGGVASALSAVMAANCKTVFQLRAVTHDPAARSMTADVTFDRAIPWAKKIHNASATTSISSPSLARARNSGKTLSP